MTIREIKQAMPSPPNTQAPLLERFLHEIKQLLRLGLPLIIGAMATTAMSITDTLMAGQAGPNELAGLAVGAGLWSAANVLMLGLAGAVAPIVGQLFGAKEKHKIAHEVHQSMWIAFAIGLLIALLALQAPSLMAMTSMDPVLANISGSYLAALALGAPALAIASSLRSFCEALGRTRVTMLVNLAAFLLNILLDYLLVFGHWGLPKLGGVGAAWSSTLIYWLMLAAFFIYVKRDRFLHSFAVLNHFEWPTWPTIKHQLHLGLPISVGSTGEVLFFGIIALMLAPLGAVAVGGHQIAQSVAALIFMLPFGQAQAVSIRIAHNVGAGKLEHAGFVARSGLSLAMMISLCTAALTVLFRHDIVALYTEDPGIRETAAHLLLFCSAYQFCDALQVVAWGALRGYKDTKIPMCLMLFSYWCVGFPLGYSIALSDTWTEAMGAQGFWIGIIIGLSVATVLLGGRLRHFTARV